MQHISIIIGAVIIAVAIFFSQPRYQIVRDTSAWQIWKLNTFTGRVERCHFLDGDPNNAYVACYNKNKNMQ